MLPRFVQMPGLRECDRQIDFGVRKLRPKAERLGQLRNRVGWMADLRERGAEPVVRVGLLW
jgi:hypothetical protein